MGFFDRGPLGRILKSLSVIRVIPEDEKSRLASILHDGALVGMTLETEDEGKIQLYWAGETHEYHEDQSYTVLSKKGQERYYFILSSLKDIKWLRIDPIDRPTKVIIKDITIEQDGYETIRMETAEALKKITPINDIRELTYGPEGVTIWTSGNDSHLEVVVEPKKSTGNKKEYFSDLLFPKKRGISENFYTANVGGTGAFPSSRLVKQELLQKNMPILSIAIDDAYLHSEKAGIISNWQQKGRDWERLAYVSYFENGKLQFATSAGLRLHGGSTRNSGLNFRLYFRKEYGKNEIEPGLIFGSNTPPIKRLVIASDRSNPRFNNCIALEIARKAGCLTPEIKPVYFLLNGKPPIDIAYFIIENLSKKQWINHIGHDDFIFLRLRQQNNVVDDQKRYDQLEEKFKHKERLTMDEVEKDINIENLSRFIIATVFCGNWDNVQGAAILNNRSVDPKWFWVMWDMDVSFLDLDWGKKGFSITLRQQEFRMTIFRRLMEECPRYHQYFLRLFMDILNHKINKSFLFSQIETFETISQKMFGSKPYFDSQTMRKFMDNRPAFIRSDLEKYYGQKYPVGESFSCTVNGASGISYRIDGYPEKPGYRGWYFKGHTIDIQIEKPFQNRFSHWIVNGEKKTDEHLIIPVDRETVIEPVFNS